MTLTVLRRCSAVIALLASFALVAACSGTSASGSLSPTGPSGTLRSSSGDVVFGPNTGDPCAPTLAGLDFKTNPDVPPPPQPPCEVASGRFTGGGFQINFNGIKVTRGFELHCDELLSNNFEVNWDGGNNFHTEKNPNVVSCTLIAPPNPPDAPVNRIHIEGTGTLNGVDGVPYTLVLIDNGEKAGAPADQAYIAINGVPLTNGSVGAPAPIDGGNIQAHFDQPHK